MMRYYVGVDWGDERHRVAVSDEAGRQVEARWVEHTEAGFSAWGQWLNQARQDGIELWAAIERPDGRLVDFLLDHGLSVYPLNPKAVDRARDRYRASSAKDDDFDAFVLSQFLRTDHMHLRPLQPNSPAGEELKLLTRDYQDLIRQQTRVLNQLTHTLKEYYPLALELFSDLSAKGARDFLCSYPTAEKAAKVRAQTLAAFARNYRWGEKQLQATSTKLKQKQIAVPAPVVRAKARKMVSLLRQLDVLVKQVEEYRAEIERFFATRPAAEWSRSLPVGGARVTVASIWAELGDAEGRWESAAHLAAQAGTAPVTQASGKRRNGKQADVKRGTYHTQPLILFRYACNHRLRYLLTQYAFLSITHCEWARAYYKQQRARGHSHYRALRALAGKWAKIFYAMWAKKQPYDDDHHLASIARHQLRQAA